jgi:putative N6-adenine-specific DNA methylase
MTQTYDIFLTATPGFEPALCAEAQSAGFTNATITQGGVTFTGTWPDIWRANLVLRGATRVLVRLGSFMAFHLAQLDKRAHKFPWADTLRPDVPVRVEVTTNRKSKIYHAGAASQRVETALKANAYQISADAELVLKLRIDDNRVTISLDTSGESLHKRGHKQGVGKAPMRETLASLMLRACGYTGTEPVLDPMCGSGTFVIEAAEIATGLYPGRSRHFAFEHLAGFDPAAWGAMRQQEPQPSALHFYGSDRDAGAIRMSRENAARAGLDHLTHFDTIPVADLTRPDGPAGLVICNPPYGDRIGNPKLLYSVYAQLGERLLQDFAGWRAAIVTSDEGMARATGLPFTRKSAPIPHGGLKVWLFQTDPLP